MEAAASQVKRDGATMMMILRSAPHSPFGRKVEIAAGVLGLMDRIEVVAADTTSESDPLRTDNPLGKVPVLILEDGTALFDSRVIIEYLDALSDAGEIIPQGEGRFGALRAQALADGILDAAILQVYERRFRPKEQRNANWAAYQAGKVERALDALEAEPGRLQMDRLDVGHIASACALGYLDLRFQGAWRDRRPQLVSFLDSFAAAVPAFAATQAAA